MVSRRPYAGSVNQVQLNYIIPDMHIYDSLLPSIYYAQTFQPVLLWLWQWQTEALYILNGKDERQKLAQEDIIEVEDQICQPAWKICTYSSGEPNKDGYEYHARGSEKASRRPAYAVIGFEVFQFCS